MRPARTGPERALLPALVLCAGLLAAACASRVDVAFADGERFEHFRTWDWNATAQSRVHAPQADAQALAAAVSRSIGRALAARGFVRDPERPDFTVAFDVRLERRAERVPVPRAPYLFSSHHSGPSYWIEGTDVEEREYAQLELDIEVVLRDGRPVWKGGVSERLEHEKTPDLDRAVEELVRRLPRPSRPLPPGLELDRVAVR